MIRTIERPVARRSMRPQKPGDFRHGLFLLVDELAGDRLGEDIAAIAYKAAIGGGESDQLLIFAVRHRPPTPAEFQQI
jgi:hypothetical protein